MPPAGSISSRQRILSKPGDPDTFGNIIIDMKLTWYLNRLRKMGPSEVFKRAIEHAKIYGARLKYADAAKWPYARFARPDQRISLCRLDPVPALDDVHAYHVYDIPFDLSRTLDWSFTVDSDVSWPPTHYSTIDYRPGTPYGDVRINWELNRLQFLPGLAVGDEALAKRILADWMVRNPYQHGPAYIASMEVAIRWISIYRAVCLFGSPMDDALLGNLTGLAVASGRFIEDRLSTHSSAGNHLIVEAVGLFWVARALEGDPLGERWRQTSRKILDEQIPRQIHPDGSGREQSFWYLIFVLDAVLHYFMLESWDAVSTTVRSRVCRALSFMGTLVMDNGGYPDFGDRDDGFIFRPTGRYDASVSKRLLDEGAKYYPDLGDMRETGPASAESSSGQPRLNTFPDGGMTLVEHGRGRLLFRHSPLGLETLCGHGHADALAVLFWWDGVPVIIDLGSGQYNGDQDVRNFFRSTIAHNTVEVGEESQSTMLGPFMWANSYQPTLHEAQTVPSCHVSASHDGYARGHSTIHRRDIDWPEQHRFSVKDRFSGPGGIAFRGAFHLGPCQSVNLKAGVLTADFGTFRFFMKLPDFFKTDLYHGSLDPFMGWHSTIYGKWEPNFSLVYSGMLGKDHSYVIKCFVKSLK